MQPCTTALLLTVGGGPSISLDGAGVMLTKIFGLEAKEPI